MAEGLTTSQILINVGVQVVNLVLFFFLFKYLIGNKLIKALEERKTLMKKLKHADEQYQHIINDANKQSQHIIAEASDHRRRLVEEAVELSQKRGDEIVHTAERKAEEIRQQAEVRSQQMQRELEENFAEGVKHTSQLVVEKLLGSKKELQDNYLDTLVNELTHDKA